MKRDIPADRQGLLRLDDPSGVTDAEAAQLASRFGTNTIGEYKPKSMIDIGRDTVRDPMLWFLAATSLVFAMLGEFADTVVLLLAIIPLVGMDFYLHRRTEASVSGLSSALATQACVVRAGRERAVAATEIVPGDLVRVSMGKSIPADGIVVEGDALQVDESSLTGEAYPVRKAPLGRERADPLGEENWVFAGTRLLTGNALVQILFTGGDTLYGEIVRAATTTRRERTRLQDDVGHLVRALLLAALALCLLLAGARLWQGHGWADAFLSAAVLAVAALPEEYPVVVTFFLGLGVYRLARRKALVRRAVAVENIGRVSVICSDKTGTITEGRVQLREVCPAPDTTARWLRQLAAMACRPGSHDPLDDALLAESPPTDDWTILASYPFTEARRREVAIGQTGGTLLAVVKGAPETVLGLCELQAAERRRIDADLTTLTATGQKVIGCAYRPVDEISEPEGGYMFAGLLGFSDPLRSGVREAVEKASRAGIQIVMISGDHPRTAEAVAREAGLSAAPVVLLGDEMEARLREGARAFLADIDVVARAAPAQKVVLVEAMRGRGAVTAVTGDGVNDVPALKAADVGIAMGLRGTQSAREVAAIVLMDDNFGTIVDAIAEGRQLFENLRLSFAFLLAVHIPLVITAALIPLMGYPLLYLPVHIVVLELFIHPAAFLGFQLPASRALDEQARDARFFDKQQLIVIVTAGSLITFAVASLFIGRVGAGASPEHARTMAMIAMIASLITLLAVFSRMHGKAPRVIVPAALLFAILATSVPLVVQAFHLHALAPRDWLISFATGALVALTSLPFHAKSRREVPCDEGAE